MIDIEIRPSTREDIPQALPLFKEFHAEVMADYDIEFDAQTILNTMIEYIDNHVAFSAFKDGEFIGCIAGVVTGMMFNHHIKTFIECAWYVAKEHRGCGALLLDRVEQYCLENEVQKIIIGNTGLVDIDVMQKFYEKRGYRLFENHYIKGLKR